MSDLIEILSKSKDSELREKVDSLYEALQSIVGVVMKIPDEVDKITGQMYASLNNIESKLNYLQGEINELKSRPIKQESITAPPLANAPSQYAQPPKPDQAKPIEPINLRASIMNELKDILTRRKQMDE